MAEDDLGFDPTLKKKKKTKKKALDLDEDLGGESVADAPAPPADSGDVDVSAPPPPSAADEAAAAAAQKKEDEANVDMLADVLEDVDFSAMKKKKKKKKTDEGSGTGEQAEDKPMQEDDAAAAPMDVGAGDDDEFSLGAKKKKKKSKKLDLDAADEGEGKDSEDVNDGGAGTGGSGHQDSDRDYEYTELLDRVFSVMRAKNPDMTGGERKKFVMKPPQVVRLGTRKSAFVNFTEICKLLHRQPDHLLAFLCAELGTSGSVDSSNALVIKGRFQQKQIESVLRRYIREYVTCHTCKSPDTILTKENRLYFLQCESCQSRCSVQNIKSGFQALTGKRAAMRAKEQ